MQTLVRLKAISVFGDTRIFVRLKAQSVNIRSHCESGFFWETQFLVDKLDDISITNISKLPNIYLSHFLKPRVYIFMNISPECPKREY